MSEAAIARDRKAWPAWTAGTSRLWRSCVAGLAALTYVAWQYLDLRRGAAAIALLTLGFVAFTLVEPRIRSGRTRAFIDQHARIAALAVPLVASALVANAASLEPQLRNYWWWFALWAAALPMAIVPFIRRLDARAAVAGLREHAWEAALVLLLVGAAAAIRAVQIGTLPDPYSGDESTFGLAALSALRGNIDNMFRSGVHGVPHMWFMFTGGMEGVFGATVVGARSGSVAVGVLAVPVTYLFLREMFGRGVALTGALFLAAYHFHNQFSRQSMSNIADPLMIPLVLWLAYRAIRDGRAVDYALTGLVLGLTLYTWVSARLLPFELAALWGWWVLMHRKIPGHLVSGAVIVAAAALVAALPLGWWWYHNEGEFNTRRGQIIFYGTGPDVSWYDEQRSLGRGPYEIIRGQTEDTFDAVFLTREDTGFYRTSIPLVDKWAFAALLPGLIWALWRIREPRYFLLLVMLAVPFVGGGVITDPPVSSARLLGIIPAVAGLVGVGVTLAGRVAAPQRPQVALGIAVGLAALIGAYNLWYYFGKYPDERTYADPNTRHAARYGDAIERAAPHGSNVYWMVTDSLNPGHPRLDFGIRDYVTYLVDESNRLVGPVRNPNDLPFVHPATAYAFAGKRLALADAFAAACPGGTWHSSEVPPELRPNERVVDLRVYVTPPDACTRFRR